MPPVVTKELFMRTLLLCIVLLPIIHVPVAAETVLVAAELPNAASISAWKEYNLQTYEYLEKTAIAEVTLDQLADLQDDGFSPRIIDSDPWTEPYFLVNRQPSGAFDMPGRSIWSGQIVILRKVPWSQTGALAASRARWREMKRMVIPQQRWNLLTERRVAFLRRESEPFIQDLVDQVSTDSLATYIQRLEDFETRLMLTDSSYAASEWLRRKWEGWGYSVVFDSFYVDGSWVGEFPGTGFERSVIAYTDGAINAADNVVIGGHFDSIVWPNPENAYTWAPGADDNATGVAAALETARLFRDHTWDRTLNFVAFGGEELGLFGAWDLAGEAVNGGIDIRGVINLDMIGYMDTPAFDLNIGYVPESRWLADLFNMVGSVYAPSIILYPEISYDGSDHAPFNALGIPAIAGEERWIPNNPHWHAPTDVSENLTPHLYTESTKIGLATLAVLALYPDAVENVVVWDVGDGEGIMIEWAPSSEPDVVGYEVFWGTEPENYVDSEYIPGPESSSAQITGLIANTPYYVIVVAADSDGYESFSAVEMTVTPRVVPSAPQGVTATPVVEGVRVDWYQNQELDTAGYRIYRRSDGSSQLDSLNSELVTDLTFTDSPLPAGTYFYSIRAFDTDGNGSESSVEVLGRPITLDQGILLVDETRNSATPSDEQQDGFYRTLLQGFTYAEFEYGSLAEAPVLSDLAPYSTIIWFAEDFAEFFAANHLVDFQRYLDGGGNLWLVGWKPIAGLQGQELYPAEFDAGTFIYDYFKIGTADLSGTTVPIAGVHGNNGYPDLAVDPETIFIPSWNGLLRYVEALTPTGDSEAIFTINAENDESSFEGLVCGIRYLGDDFNTVFFGFPLFYMDHTQAQTVARMVLQDFGEPLGTQPESDPPALITHLNLEQCEPNPFSNETTVAYQVPDDGDVQLHVYDLNGRLVRTLVDEHQAAGQFHVPWDGTDDHGRPLTSGAYFAQLHACRSSRVTNVILIR
jgi:hypothetical protein